MTTAWCAQPQVATTAAALQVCVDLPGEQVLQRALCA